MKPGLYAISLAHLQALAESHEAFVQRSGLSAAAGALLPSEFIRAILPRAEQDAPWLGYWVVLGEEVVGSGMFKNAPTRGVVEIGYGVAPSVEGRGFATLLANKLWEFADSHGAEAVIAHTLPDGFASQRVLAKAGFTLAGEVSDPEDGQVLRFFKLCREADANGRHIQDFLLRY